MGTRLRPLRDLVVVRRTAAKDTSDGGIIIPDKAKKKPAEGIVEEIGPGAYDQHGHRREMMVKRGDRVVFSDYSGNEVSVDGEKFTVLSEAEILAVLDR